MQRRKLLAGLGSLAAGGAAAIGSGAFTSVEADRTVDVEVAGDSSAYLALQEASDSGGSTSANSAAYLDTSGAAVSFDFSSNNTTTDLGDGFNPNAVTEVEDLIEVQNQGTQSVYLSVDTASLDISDGSGGQAYVGLAVSNPDDTGDSSADNELNANIAFDSQGTNPNGSDIPAPTTHELAVGDSVHLDLTVDTTDFAGSGGPTSGSVTFIADQNGSIQ